MSDSIDDLSLSEIIADNSRLESQAQALLECLDDIKKLCDADAIGPSRKVPLIEGLIKDALTKLSEQQNNNAKI